MPKIVGRMPTVPEYYQEHINMNVSLLDNPKQCCPFHNEKTPSFSFNPETGRWSCFGACHAHGDVIDMHQRIYHLSNRDEARKSLMSLYEVNAVDELSKLDDWTRTHVNEDRVYDEVSYQRALALATTPDRWLRLDYVMSIVPVETWRLVELINEWSEA